jgi:hypothetical protein
VGFQGSIGVSGVLLLSPKDGLTPFLLRHNFGLWDVECGDFVAAPVLNIVLHIHNLNVCFSIEAAKVPDCELA